MQTAIITTAAGNIQYRSARGSAALLSGTALVACFCVSALLPPAVQAQTIPQNPANVTGTEPLPGFVTQGVDYTNQESPSGGGLSGGPANGWAVTVDTLAQIKGSDAALVSVVARGGNGQSAEQAGSGSADGGSGGNTGTIDFTILSPENNGSISTLYQLSGAAGAKAIDIRSVGGNGAKGQSPGTGDGGSGGLGGVPGTINFYARQNALAPQAYNFLYANIGATAISLYAQGGNGGDGGDADGSSSKTGAAAQQGQTGGDIVAVLSMNMMTGGGIGINATSIGGVGGNGGQGSSTWGEGTGGAGGQGGDGGNVTIYQPGGSIFTAGSGQTTSVEVDGPNNGQTQVTLEMVDAAIIAQSLGGAGGSAGGADGWAGKGNKGGTAGSGGTVSVNLLGSGIYQTDGGYVKFRDNGAISTSGDNAVGVLASSIGAAGGGVQDVGGAFAKHGGSGGTGGNGGQVYIATAQTADPDNDYVLISTNGQGSDAIIGQSIGGGGGTGGDVNGGGVGFTIQHGGKGGNGGDGGSAGIDNGYWTTSNGANVFVKPYAIHTQGGNSHAMLIQSIGGGGGRGGNATGIGGGVGSLVIGGSGGTGGDGLDATISSYGVVQTEGDHSFGAFAQSVGGGGGAGGSALAIDIGSILTSSTAIGGRGGNGGDGGAATIYNFGQVITNGSDSHALLAQSVGGGGGHGGSSLAEAFAINPPETPFPTVTLDVAIGGRGGTGGDGSTASLYNSNIVATQGVNAFGMFAQSVGGGGGTGGDSSSLSQAYTQSTITAGISIGGAGASGGVGGDVDLANSGLVLTLNYGSHALFAQSVGGGGGNGGLGQTNQGSFNSADGTSVNLTVGLGGSGGAGGDGGDVTVYNYIDADNFPSGTSSAPQGKYGNGGILTAGVSAAGIFAQSVGGGGGNAGSAIGQGGNASVALNVALGGNGGAGGDGGNVSVSNGQGGIVTLGASSPGVFAQSIGGGGGNGGNATTGSGNDPQYYYPQYMFGDMLKKFNNSDAQNITNNLWDWKDNVFGEWGNVPKLKSIYDGYAANNDPVVPPPAPAGGLTVSDITIDIGAGRAGGGGKGGDGGDVTVENTGGVQTAGAGSSALFGQSIGGGGGNAGGSTAVAGNNHLPVAMVQGQINIGAKGGKGGDGGNISMSNGTSAQILTTGDMSHGLHGLSVGGGGGLAGISSSEGSVTGVVNVTLGSDSGTGGQGGIIGLDNYAQIVTQGDDAIGMAAQSIGGGGGYVSITSQAQDASTQLAYSISQGNIVRPDSSGGIFANLTNPGAGSGGGDVTATLHASGTISTSGINAYGILAQSLGGGGGVFILDKNNGAIRDYELFQAGGTVHQNDGGVVQVVTEAGSSITTAGAGAAGIFAHSIGGGGGIVNGLNGASLTGYGYGLESFVPDRGGNAGVSGSVDVTSAGNITTTGAYAHGILAHAASNGGGVIGRADGSGYLLFEINQENLSDNVCKAACGKVNVTVGNSANSSTVAVSGANAFGVAGVSWGNPKGSNYVVLTIASQASVLATGNAEAAILIAGQNIANLNNFGLIDGTASAKGVAILHMGNYATLNQGHINGSLVNGLEDDAAAALGVPLASSFDNMASGVFNAGAVVDLGAGGVLRNAGTLGIGAVPGIGSTVLTGHLDQQAGGVLHIDADMAGGKADSLQISGTATIAGTVHVAPTSVSNRSLKVLSAAGGLALDPSLAMTDTSHLYDFRSSVSGNDMSVSAVANFKAKAMGFGANEKSVAASLQSLFDGGASADKAFTRLLAVADDAGYAAGLKSLAGQGLGAFGAFRFNSSRTFAANLYGGCTGLRLEDRSTERCGWARTLVNNTTQEAGTDTHGYKADAWALQMGGQTPLSDDLALTGSVAYEGTTFRDEGRTARIKGDTLVAGLGLLYAPARLELSAGIDAAYGWYKSRRTISLGLTEQANASPKQSQLGGHVRGAYNLLDEGKSFVRPFVEGHAIHVSNKAFTETGTSPFRLAVEGRADTALIGVAGVELGTAVALSGTVSLRPFASAAIEYGSPREWTTTARFAEQPQGESFDLQTAGPGTLGRFTIGADLIGAKNIALSVQYAPELGKNFTSHSGTAKLTIAF